MVTSPRTRATCAPRRWPVERDLDEQTELGAVYVRALMRAQARQASVTCVIVVVVLAVLPPLLVCAPQPLPWLIPAVGVQGVWALVACRHVRRAERAEREFTELVRRS